MQRKYTVRNEYGNKIGTITETPAITEILGYGCLFVIFFGYLWWIISLLLAVVLSIITAIRTGNVRSMVIFWTVFLGVLLGLAGLYFGFVNEESIYLVVGAIICIVSLVSRIKIQHTPYQIIISWHYVHLWPRRTPDWFLTGIRSRVSANDLRSVSVEDAIIMFAR